MAKMPIKKIIKPEITFKKSYFVGYDEYSIPIANINLRDNIEAVTRGLVQQVVDTDN